MKRTITGVAVALCLLLLLLGGWKLSKSRSFQFYGGLVTHVETDERIVALTLDDGPSRSGTRKVLAVLDSLGVRATFFVTGHELEENPREGQAIVQAGHALGNHSYSHQQMVLHSTAFIRHEIEATDSLIRAAGWTGDVPFRPPYGKRLFLLPRYLHRTARSTVLWDIEPESYPDVAASAERMTAHVVEKVRPGSILLMHVMYDSREESRRALPMIVGRLRDMGYRFVTVPELMTH